MRYAQNTYVAVEKSEAEIKGMLIRYGADQFVSGWAGNKAAIGFDAMGRKIRFELPLPDKDDERLYKTPTGRSRRRSEEEKYKIWEQACRQRWRALALVVKAKLEAVECGITTFEEEFYAHIVMPGGKTLYQMTKGNVEIAYKTGKIPSLLEFK